MFGILLYNHKRFFDVHKKRLVYSIPKPTIVGFKGAALQQIRTGEGGRTEKGQKGEQRGGIVPQQFLDPPLEPYVFSSCPSSHPSVMNVAL